MANINDGGPAFARSGCQWTEDPGTDGMSLRDYFAAAALTGVIANSIALLDESEAAESAYLHADAMLKARMLKARKAGR